ncbi:hypothetical protein AX774_g1886 [Zancudomyces culisetae]|uniref:Inositolphosphotransferase Aur1/Ipt1 domain-containing protein n=1 Tax=Zancudomyces culisetae TaxID=1213189 RepID=A0A1R1PUC9_ZANCU|nr:hypothetical protein AX774_g1886 [Zancudomyces culisetae]|eukprot:OMH84588.1 hypothetical protein AX774_g1886 [Zancudomyces culisetae]
MKARAIRNGVRITEIEKALGMFVEESIQQWALSGENPEKVTSRIKFWNDYYAFAHPAVCITTLLFLGFAFGVAYYRQQQRIRRKIWEQGRIETQIGIEMEVDNVQVMEMVEEGNDAFVIKSPRSRRNDSGMTNSKLLEQEEFYDDHQEKEEGQLFNGINILNGNQNTYRYRQLDEPTSPELERGSLYGNRNQRVENFKDIEIGKLFSVKNALNRYRYYVSVFVLAEFLSVLGFILIPTMPPRLLSECDAMNLDGIGLGGCIYTLGKMVIGDGEGMMEISGNVPMFGFIDTIDKYGSRFFSWKDQTVQALNNPYAAMPSQHTMVALWAYEKSEYLLYQHQLQHQC